MTDPTIDLALELIGRRSITPEDAGCQALVAERLEPAGFAARHQRYGEVDNVLLRRGDAAPLLVFLGHTDVVPPGDEADWRVPPFAPAIVDGALYGRGASDMKGAVAAFVTAAERFVAAHPDHAGSIGIVLTSDEEGPGVDGTVKVIEDMTARGEQIDYCLVGEPTSSEALGDKLRVGRRGSLNGYLTVRGVQGHVAYPELVDNPIHKALAAMDALAREVWCEGHGPFPPTSFQWANVAAGTGAPNVVPAALEAQLNVRYSSALDRATIERRTAEVFRDAGLTDYELRWVPSAEPFVTEGGALVEAICAAVEAETGRVPERSTAGGTSDGRFVAPTGAQVVELGPSNATIHSVDERVLAEDLVRLSAIYEDILRRLLCPGPASG